MGDPPAVAAASIAEIREGDLSAVAALHACCFDEPWRPELIGRIAQAPGCFGLLWRCEDEPLGFVLGRTNHALAEVLSLGVAPAARERGIARALMHAAIDWVSRRDLRALYLEVAEDNTAALRLYRALGFARVGRRPRLLRQTADRRRGRAHLSRVDRACCPRRRGRFRRVWVPRSVF